MPKLRSVKAMRKRFKLTGTGKVLFRAIGQSHLLQAHSRKVKRQAKKWGRMFSTGAEKKVRPFIV